MCFSHCHLRARSKLILHLGQRFQFWPFWEVDVKFLHILVHSIGNVDKARILFASGGLHLMHMHDTSHFQVVHHLCIDIWIQLRVCCEEVAGGHHDVVGLYSKFVIFAIRGQSSNVSGTEDFCETIADFCRWCIEQTLDHRWHIARCIW